MSTKSVAIQFVETTEFSQAKELLPLFAKQFTYEISYRTLLTALHKIGWTYKKRVLPTKKERWFHMFEQLKAYL